MVDANYTDIKPNTTVRAQGRAFNHGQISLLSRSMLNAGVGFILIALIGFGISMGLIYGAADKIGG
jgi:hypothetical protein